MMTADPSTDDTDDPDDINQCLHNKYGTFIGFQMQIC